MDWTSPSMNSIVTDYDAVGPSRLSAVQLRWNGAQLGLGYDRSYLRFCFRSCAFVLHCLDDAHHAQNSKSTSGRLRHAMLSLAVDGASSEIPLHTSLVARCATLIYHPVSDSQLAISPHSVHTALTTLPPPNPKFPTSAYASAFTTYCAAINLLPKSSVMRQ
jgi:hypothetical protein